MKAIIIKNKLFISFFLIILMILMFNMVAPIDIKGIVICLTVPFLGALFFSSIIKIIIGIIKSIAENIT